MSLWGGTSSSKSALGGLVWVVSVHLQDLPVNMDEDPVLACSQSSPLATSQDTRVACVRVHWYRAFPLDG